MPHFEYGLWQPTCHLRWRNGILLQQWTRYKREYSGYWQRMIRRDDETEWRTIQELEV